MRQHIVTDEDDERGTPGPPGALGAFSEGWHALGGGDAARCPGCPVCRLSSSAGRLDPAAAEHLQQAVGHVVSAGRELLAALGAASRPVAPPDHPGDAGTGEPTDHGDPGPSADPPPAPPRTRIRVDPQTTRPDRGNEEQG